MSPLTIESRSRTGLDSAAALPHWIHAGDRRPMRHGYRAEALGKIFHVGHGNREDPASWSVPHFLFPVTTEQRF